MKILVVDDETPARERLKRLIDEQDEWQVVGEARNGREALEQVDATQPDLVLLDIRMPGMDGIETARHLAQMDEPPAVIFTTAFDEYAVEAFDASAVGYVLKPKPKRKPETSGCTICRRTCRISRDAARRKRPCWRHCGARAGRRRSRR